MKRNILNLFALLMVLAALSSCGSSQNKLTHFAFKSDRSDNWGLVSTSGEILFEDEFEHTPTCVYCDRFWVKNSDDEWELYTADEKPRQIGESYKEACDFICGVAPVVREDMPIEVITPDGEVKFTFEKADGKTVERMSNFYEGYAVFETVDGERGLVDTDGNITVPAGKYVFQSSEVMGGKILAFSKKSKDKELSVETADVIVLSPKGKELYTIKKGKYERVYNTSKENLVEVHVRKGDNRCPALINLDGEYVLEPSKRIEEIEMVLDDGIIYRGSDGYGFMTFDGEVVLRPKYKTLIPLSTDGDRFLAGKRGDMKLIDREGNQIGKEEFEKGGYIDGDYAVVRLEDDNWQFLSISSGELLKNGPEMAKIDDRRACSYVTSDKLDYEAIVDAMKLTPTSMYGFAFGLGTEEIMGRYGELKNAEDVACSLEAESYRYNQSLSLEKSLMGVHFTFELTFPENIGQAITHTERENYYYYYYDRTVVDGYEFTKTKPRYSYTFSNYGKLNGKLPQLYDQLKSKLRMYGTVDCRDADNCVVQLKNGGTVNLMKSENYLSLVYAPNDAENYAEAAEEVEAEAEAEEAYEEAEVAE